MKFEYVFDIGGEPGFAIIQDRDGFLWFSSFYNGMLRFDGSSKWMIREGADGISNDFVTQLFEDRDGNIWAGTNHGLNRYDKRSNTITRFFKDPTRPESSLAGNVFNLSSRTIIQDRQGYLWFGTQSGLSRYDPETDQFNNYQHKSGDPQSLSDNNIFGLFQDSEGFIWVTTPTSSGSPPGGADWRSLIAAGKRLLTTSTILKTRKVSVPTPSTMSWKIPVVIFGLAQTRVSTNSTSRPASSNASTRALDLMPKLSTIYWRTAGLACGWGPISVWWFSTSTTSRLSGSTLPKMDCIVTIFSPPRGGRHAMASYGSEALTDSTGLIRKTCRKIPIPCRFTSPRSNRVDSSAKSLLGIINDILDFSKIEAGKLDMESLDFQLEDTLDNIATLVGIKTQEKGLELLFKTDPSMLFDTIIQAFGEEVPEISQVVHGHEQEARALEHIQGENVL